MNRIKNMQFIKKENGSVLVETVLIMPLLILLLACVFEAGRLMVLHQKLLHASYSAADFLTRDSIVTNTDIDNAFIMVQLALEPFDTDPSLITMNVAGVVYAGISADSQQNWQDSTHADDTDADLEKQIDNLGGEVDEGYLVLKLNYAYSPFIFTALDLFSASPLFTDQTLTSTYVLKSRESECISYDISVGDYICP